MAINNLDISKVRNLKTVLSKTPNGSDASELMRKLGLWTYASHMRDHERPEFLKNLGTADDLSISTQLGIWTSEYGRITELHGAFVGQKEQVKLQLKGATAEARVRIRRKNREGENPKSMAAAELNDLVESDPQVMEILDKLAILELILAQTAATKEATAQYIATISREISFRDAQAKSKNYR